MISVTYGNVPQQRCVLNYDEWDIKVPSQVSPLTLLTIFSGESSCLRNVVSLFHVLEKELDWRQSKARVGAYETMRAFKPIIAVGPEHPLDDEALMADHFRE